MSSPGFCLETLLEAAKFVELQEQQLQQASQQQKQIFVVASGTDKLVNDTQLAPLSSIKQEELHDVKGWLKGKES
ncbi:hypothetical protein WDU94_010253 [Cyamophila willieti]